MGRGPVIVLDTHAWIWWLAEPAKLGKRAKEHLGSAPSIGVSAISCWEIATLVAKRRLGLDRDVLEWLEAACHQPRLDLIPITPAIAVRSTRLPPEFRADPADRIIVATAAIFGATLITKDDGIRGFSRVPTAW